MPAPKTLPRPRPSGWKRPSLPPEGEANFLEDHPFNLIRTLPDSVLVEQVRT